MVVGGGHAGDSMGKQDSGTRQNPSDMGPQIAGGVVGRECPLRQTGAKADRARHVALPRRRSGIHTRLKDWKLVGVPRE